MSYAINMSYAIRFALTLLLPCFLAACGASTAADHTGGIPAPTGNTMEFARQKLIDSCMFDPSVPVTNDRTGKGPYCQCYAQGVAKRLTQADAVRYASTGALPWPAKPDGVCR